MYVPSHEAERGDRKAARGENVSLAFCTVGLPEVALVLCLDSPTPFFAVLRYLEPLVKASTTHLCISPCHHKRIHAYTPATVMPETTSSYFSTMPVELIITFSAHHKRCCSEYEVLLPLYALSTLVGIYCGQPTSILRDYSGLLANHLSEVASNSKAPHGMKSNSANGKSDLAKMQTHLSSLPRTNKGHLCENAIDRTA
jgi:hypothetical protein